jgi:hypothetical protein
MKTLSTFLVSAFILMATTGMAQTADQVIIKYIAAMGGKEKLESLKTVKMEGNLSTQGVDVALTITKKHLEGMRIDLEIMGTANYQLANKAAGWKFMPIMQQAEPTEMTAEEHKSIVSQFDVQGSLFNYKEKGYTVEYVGTEKLDGKDVYKLKAVKNGADVFYFIDVSSNFIVKTAAKINASGQETEVETKFTDYKQNSDGYWFSYTNVTTQGTITFDKISANVAVDDKIFTN